MKHDGALYREANPSHAELTESGERVAILVRFLSRRKLLPVSAYRARYLIRTGSDVDLVLSAAGTRLQLIVNRPQTSQLEHEIAAIGFTG